MKTNVRIILISLTALVLIISFQNCAQEEGLAPGIDSAWNSIQPPSAEPTPTLSKEGAQCTAPTYYGAKNCSSPSVSFMFKDMPIDGYGKPYPTNVVVPDGCTLMIVKVWGAGGGSNSDGGAYGGAGAYVSGTIPVGPGEVFKVIVGEGGKPGGDSTFGGGGAGGTVNGISAGGASGGGRSAIQRGYYDIVTAGGGGGAASSAALGGLAGINPGNGGNYWNAWGGGAATNGDATTVAKAGTAGTNTATNGGNGTAGSRFQGGNGGNGNPGSGGGGGGYFGGGGGASSGMQSPSSDKSHAAGGGGGASYIGCGNLVVSGVDAINNGYQPTAPERIPGFNAPPLAGLFASCDTPSRPGGNSNSYVQCQGQTKGSDGFIYIEWR